MSRLPQRNEVFVITALILILLVLFLSSTYAQWADFLQVSYIDVGQGDSILLHASDDTDILIDGGPRSAGPTVVAYLQNKGIDDIEVMVLTHGDADHVGGLIDVLRSTIPVESVIYNGRHHTSLTYQEFITETQARGLTPTPAQAGQIHSWGSITTFVLNPQTQGTLGLDQNDNSVVMLVVYGDMRFLFTGDISSNIEQMILNTGTLRLWTEADILKVAQHGSEYSSSEPFLEAVGAEVAVISVGASNPYGHPAQETLDRLQAAGAKVLRTDRNGTIVVTTDGQTYEIDASYVVFLPMVMRIIPTPTNTPQPPSQDPYEPNDTRGTAYIFPVVASASARNANFIPSATDEDWFAFYTKSGQDYRAITSNLLGVDTYLEVFDEDGDRVAFDDNGGGGFASKVEWQAAYNGYHYIRVSNLAFVSPDNNTYDLLIAETGVAAVGPYEPNDTMGMAYVFPVAAFVNARNANFVPSATDEDWFAFYAKLGQDYWADTSNLLGVDTYLRVFDENGNLIAYDDDGGGGFASRVEWQSVYKGYYYIQVRNLVGTSMSWDTYDLSIGERGVNVTATPTPTPYPTPLPPPPTSSWPTPTARVTPTWSGPMATPIPVLSLPPTWTPYPTNTPAPGTTLPPTWTPRPTNTPVSGAAETEEVIW